MIEVFDVVRTVMAVRAYQDKPIPEERPFGALSRLVI